LLAPNKIKVVSTQPERARNSPKAAAAAAAEMQAEEILRPSDTSARRLGLSQRRPNLGKPIDPCRVKCFFTHFSNDRACEPIFLLFFSQEKSPFILKK
jgi:hypothetical protein